MSKILKSIFAVAVALIIGFLAGFIMALLGGSSYLGSLAGVIATMGFFAWFHSRNSDKPDSQSDLDRANSREQEVRALVKEGLLSESDGVDASRANSREQLEGEPDQPESPGGNIWFIKELWQGNVPLWKTYWLFTVIPNFLGELVFVYMEIISLSEESTAYLTVSAVALAYMMFIYVAVWRSAGKYKGSIIYQYLARIAVLIGVLAVLATMFTPTEITESSLRQEAGIMNQGLPEMVDDGLRLEKVLVEGMTVTWDYTLVNFTGVEFDATSLDDFKEEMKDDSCAALNDYIEAGVTYIYRYSGNDGGLIESIILDQQNCSQP